jgi:lactoylglutathione lyase
MTTATARPAPSPSAAAKYRMLHTMLRVRDLDRSLHFYCGLLGMRELRRQSYPEGRFTLAFVGYGDESDHTVLELTHNWDQDKPYEIGTGYGHVAIGVPDIYAACDELAREGVKIPRPPGPMKHGTTVIAFIEDPDGYKVELIERK